MPNLRIHINEKKYPTKIEFCCDEMAGALCKRHSITFYSWEQKERWGKIGEPERLSYHCEIGLTDRPHGQTLACCPFCKGDIEIIEKEVE